MIETKDIYWLAGLLEGEGAFCSTAKGRYPKIMLRMNDLDIVQRANAIFRPTVFRKNGNSATGPYYDRTRLGAATPYYRSNISGVRAVGWMLMIYPLMGERRRARIRELIIAWRLRSHSSALVGEPMPTYND
jgi:hypothetical protein